MKLFGVIINLNEIADINLLGIEIKIMCRNSKDIQNFSFHIKMGDVWAITTVNKVYSEDLKWLEIHLSNRIIEQFKSEVRKSLDHA